MRIDGRSINRAKLEERRFEAVRRVQAGEAPTAVAREMGLYTRQLRNFRVREVLVPVIADRAYRDVASSTFTERES
jgi:hypothetical protein